jgi:hypothetical protein
LITHILDTHHVFTRNEPLIFRSKHWRHVYCPP